MMLGYKKLGGVVLGTVALLTFMPAAADAQFVSYSPIFWSADARGGISLPLGDFGDVVDAGPGFGVGVAYFLNRRLALRADGSLTLFQGKDDVAEQAPDVHAWRYWGGIEFHLANPSPEGMTTGGAKKGLMATLNLGIGGVTYNSDQFVVEGFNAATGQPEPGATTTAAFQDTYVGVNGGLNLGYNASRVFTIFIGAQAHAAFLAEEDTGPLAFLMGQEEFSTAIDIPIHGGFRINVP